MSPSLSFAKVTPGGLCVDVEEWEGQQILFLSKDLPTTALRPCQILGTATHEINDSTVSWHYDYELLPRTMPRARLEHWLQNRGYQVGMFDQFSNFAVKAA